MSKASFWLWGLLATSFFASGCITSELRKETLKQSQSSVDTRYREVMENLAVLYANPEALPSYSSIYAGTSDLSDTFQATSATTWQKSFNNQYLDIPLQRAVKDTWDLDPTIVPEKLTAMKCACRWVLFGSDQIGPDGWILYGPPKPTATTFEEEPPPRCYFGVAQELANIDSYCPNWLHCSDNCHKVPRCACYKACCHGKYVWVEPDGMPGLSRFALVIQKIARATYKSLLSPVAKTREFKLTCVTARKLPSTSQLPSQTRKKCCGPDEEFVDIDWFIDSANAPTPGDGLPALPLKLQFDNEGTGATIKSALSAITK